MKDEDVTRAMIIMKYARHCRQLADIVDVMLKDAHNETSLAKDDIIDIVWILSRAKAHLTDAQSELVSQALKSEDP